MGSIESARAGCLDQSPAWVGSYHHLRLLMRPGPILILILQLLMRPAVYRSDRAIASSQPILSIRLYPRLGGSGSMYIIDI